MIMRIAIVLVVSGSTLLLSGCSYSAEFVLVNKSADTLVIEYSMKPTDAMPFPKVKAGLASIHQHEANWREFNAFPDERLWVSEDRRSARVTLLPNEVLFLASHDIREINDEPVFKSGIAELSIMSNSGSATFEGDQVYTQFIPSESGFFPGFPLLYTITIKK